MALYLLPLRHSELDNQGLAGTIPDDVGAFVDIATFDVGNYHLNGSLPASMSAWKKVAYFDVRGSHLHTALPVLNYRAMTQCVLCAVGEPNDPCGKDGRNYFTCPFPEGVTDRCTKFNGNMEYSAITNADCHNTTASE